MAIEIRELVVRGTVGPGTPRLSAATANDAAEHRAPARELPDDLAERLIARLRERLQERRER